MSRSPVLANPNLATRAEQLKSQLVREKGKETEHLQFAKTHLARVLRQDLDWWYGQAKRIVENPMGRIDENATKIVMGVFNKILPDKREVVREEEVARVSPVQINIGGGMVRRPQIDIREEPADGTGEETLVGQARGDGEAILADFREHAASASADSGDEEEAS